MDRIVDFRPYNPPRDFDYHQNDFKEAFGWCFHMMNTNFRISRDCLHRISEVDGVESIEPFSDYKLRIGIAELFDVEKVKENIRVAIFEENKLSTLDRYKNYKNTIGKDSKYFAVVFSGNNSTFVMAQEKEVAENKLQTITKDLSEFEVEKSWN